MGDPVVEKKPWQSKTVWAGIIVAVAPLYPPLQEWLSHNPGAFSAGLGLIFALLRIVSKDKVSL